MLIWYNFCKCIYLILNTDKKIFIAFSFYPQSENSFTNSDFLQYSKWIWILHLLNFCIRPLCHCALQFFSVTEDLLYIQRSVSGLAGSVRLFRCARSETTITAYNCCGQPVDCPEFSLVGSSRERWVASQHRCTDNIKFGFGIRGSPNSPKNPLISKLLVPRMVLSSCIRRNCFATSVNNSKGTYECPWNSSNHTEEISRIKYQFKSVAKISLCYSTLIFTKTDAIKVRASIELTSNQEFRENAKIHKTVKTKKTNKTNYYSQCAGSLY